MSRAGAGSALRRRGPSWRRLRRSVRRPRPARAPARRAGCRGRGTRGRRSATSGDHERDGRERRRGEERRPHARDELARAPRRRRTPRRSTATPTALPSCWVVCSSPEAAPACSGSTPPSTVAVTGMKTRPADEARRAASARRPRRGSCRRRRAWLSQHEADGQAERADHRSSCAAPSRRDQPRGDPRHREDAEAERQEREAGRQRAEAEHAAGRTARRGRTSTAAPPTTSAITARAPTRRRLRSRRGWISGCATPALGAGQQREQGQRRRRSRRGCGPRSSRARACRSAPRRARPRRGWR